MEKKPRRFDVVGLIGLGPRIFPLFLSTIEVDLGRRGHKNREEYRRAVAEEFFDKIP
jgi:hypothetical protein